MISALPLTTRLKAFHPWGKMFYPCIYLYSGCYGFSSVPTGLSALPAPLHFDALPLVGLDCTGEHVQLVSEHSSFCLGNETLKKHLHENAIKIFFFRWIVQAVSRDDSSKCSVKATQYRMDRGWGTEVGRSTPTAVSIEATHLTYIILALCFNSAVVIWWNTLTPKTQALFIAGLKQSVFCSMYQYNIQQFFFNAHGWGHAKTHQYSACFARSIWATCSLNQYFNWSKRCRLFSTNLKTFCE